MSCGASLRDRRPPGVPVGVALEERSSGHHRAVVPDAADELYADRESLRREATRDADRGQATEIANSAERVGEREAGFKICFEGGRSDGERGRNQDIELIERSVLLFLENAANLQLSHVVVSRELLVEVSANLSER